MGCDLHVFFVHRLSHKFQSTHPRGVRPTPTTPGTTYKFGFNPRTRVGCDQPLRLQEQHINSVSIHAPAWGATYNGTIVADSIVVSIHAPAWGATFYKGSLSATYDAFQSTHPRGVRPGIRRLTLCHHPVSIHAPAWGATVVVLRR